MEPEKFVYPSWLNDAKAAYFAPDFKEAARRMAERIDREAFEMALAEADIERQMEEFKDL